MSVQTKKPTVKAVRFYATTGGKTKNGGTLVGSSSLSMGNRASVLEGDKVIYPGGETAMVVRDESTHMACCEKTAAATGTAISNGDVIVDAGQQSMALAELDNGQFTAVYFDEEKVGEFKSRGLL